ncbi:Sensor histidine kinase QseE [bacterium HR20]|nr:Sensor histidine kinase QseE [bacterium HR20]
MLRSTVPMDDWRKRIADLVVQYFGVRGVTRSRLELFLRQIEPLLATVGEGDLPAELRHIVANLQTMTILLRRREQDGEPIYVLREGRLAGQLTTERVRGKSPRELFPPEVNAVTLPMVARAFAGEESEFTYALDGRTFLTYLHPFRRDAHGNVLEVLGSMVDVTSERRYAAELEHNEQLFRALIENMPCGVLYEERTADGRVTQLIANPEFTRLTGYTVEDYRDTPPEQWSERVHPDDREQVQQQYRAWLESTDSEPLHLQYRFYDRYGIVRWLDNYLARIFYEDGRDGVLQVVLDITERATAEQRLRHAASYLEQSIEPIIECDENFRVTFLNRAARQAFPELDYGAFLSEHPLGSDLPPQCTDDQYVALVHVGSRAFQRLLARTDRGWRLFCHDVTPLVEAEQTLRRTLEREQALKLLRSQFVSTLSHEFRTPLAGILTAAQLLERYGAVMSDEQRKDAIGTIVARVRDLEHIVHSFTRRSSLLGRTEVQQTPIELPTFIVRLAEQLEIVQRKGAHVAVEGQDCRVLADAELLSAALQALLDNAARYGPDGATITVEFSVGKGRLCINVHDEGVGIPEQEMERLFTPYFRSSRTGNIPGSGLSLATLKPLVEASGGDLRLCNKYPAGVCATVELPCVVEAADVQPIAPLNEQATNDTSH